MTAFAVEMKPMRPLLLAALLLAPVTLAAPALAAPAKPAKIGIFDGQSDVGNPKLAGGVTFSRGRYAIKSGGYNVARTRDEFHFVWRKVKGDFAMDARVAFTGPGITPHRKGGIMARASLGEGAAHIDATVMGDGPRSAVVRQADGGPTTISELEPRGPEAAGTPAPAPAPTVPQSVHLERRGNLFTIVLRAPGKPDLTRTTELALPEEIYLGLFLSAHNPEVVESATIDQVRLTAR
ncbi:hypothetical protein H7F51_11280 [Novosphingobium flavum]|uniref:DUF3108 domain-containing protein n=1 Tax=Novosphingobium flavum TaxID=1778672 RepID=A0A7X1FSL4_9SPHN|nr:hypothetical protein [Novosphingobium flavum]MBC2666099.1 hypothetical protein [Novosphingobium flavum]